MDNDALIFDNQFLRTHNGFNKTSNSRSSQKILSPMRQPDSFRSRNNNNDFPKLNEPLPNSHRGIRKASAHSKQSSADYMRNDGGRSQYSNYDQKCYYMDSESTNNILPKDGHIKPPKGRLAP